MPLRSVYPAYRNSGVDFLGNIPESWNVTRIANVFEERKVFNHPDDLLLSIDRYRGIIKQSETGRKVRASQDRSGYKLIEPGQLGYNILNAFMGSIGVSKYRGIVSPAYAVARLRTEQESWYFHYLLRTSLYQRQFNRFSYGIMYERNRLYYDRFKIIPIPVPPKFDQDQIVVYLRAQDSRIARFIKAKRDLIALLTEQKQIIIEGAVTQGLDATMVKIDSGIDWIPRIPAHWEICKIKHVAVFNPSRSESAALRLGGESASFLPMECITTDGKLQNVESRKVTEVWEGYTYFRRNDIVMAKITPCFENGKGGLLDALPTDVGFGTTEFIVLRAAAKRVRPAFLAKLLSLKTFRVLGADAMTGAAGQQRVPLDFVKNFRIALPSLDEQDQILSALETATVQQDAAIERIRSEIALVREYRDRLIADVVTGQMDVRGWLPSPDDVVNDEELAALEDDQEDMTGEEDVDGEN
ncbi:restriction endonuclease subunit S [Pseudomonas thivervalensis]|uniref:Restriction endonuclease subunit S n=1 Tax=Pseudomonas thivervalensis TaxID=86265 RepID=A0A2Z4ZGX3_9PSED|nr:restriction endonuclease subunit S [Pseudomonas thivervalensis]AXA57408.1 restriction endonuclease subunit S [Pseudomonas thivervalensis]AXA63122.1 restriction endonuclease subunit S [Pseudomonas thivervalensis]